MSLARPRSETAVAPAKFDHVVFRTRQKGAMVAWWTTVLQARVQHENPILAFLTYDDEHHRIALVNLPGLTDPSAEAAGLSHLAYTYASLGDLLDTYVRLKADGVIPEWTVNHGPTTSMYYRDPDGNQVELQVDNFPSVEELHAWFRSGAFARNPVGVEYDPDDLVRRFNSGVPVAELVARGD